MLRNLLSLLYLRFWLFLMGLNLWCILAFSYIKRIFVFEMHSALFQVSVILRNCSAVYHFSALLCYHVKAHLFVVPFDARLRKRSSQQWYGTQQDALFIRHVFRKHWNRRYYYRSGIFYSMERTQLTLHYVWGGLCAALGCYYVDLSRWVRVSLSPRFWRLIG